MQTDAEKTQRLHFLRLPLYGALVGDSVDNIPGVKNLGPKAYLRLYTAYGDDGLLEIQTALRDNNWKAIEAAYEATGDKDLFAVLENWSHAKLMLDLVTLHPEACYGALDGRKVKRPIWYARVPNREKVLEVLADAGIPSQLRHFEKYFPIHRLLTTDDAAEMPAIAQEIMASQVLSWDYESWDPVKHEPFQVARKGYVDVLSQQITGVSVNYGVFNQKTIYLPVAHANTANFPKEWVTWLLQTLDQREDRSIVQNASFELTLSQTNLGFMPRAPYDTRIMAAYVDENEEAGLKDLSLRCLGYRQTSYQEVTGGRGMNELTGEAVLQYGCDDSLVTSWLFMLFKDISLCEGSWAFYCQNEISPAINDSLDFISGTEINYSLLAEFAKESEKVIKENSEIVQQVLGEHCTPDSYGPQDTQELTCRAMTLHQEWMTTKAVKYAGDPEALQAASVETWEKAWGACFYTPRHSEVVVTPFAPTVTGLNRILGLLDPEAPKIKKASAAGVEELDGLIMDYVGGARQVSSSATASDLVEFMRLLFAARKRLGAAARSGQEYAALQEFCQEILARHSHGKTVSTGDELNMGSGPQMQAMLYGKLGLPIRKRSKITRGSLRDVEKLPGSAAVGLKAIAAAFVYDLPEGEDWRKDVLGAYRKVALEQQNQSLYYTPYPLWQHPKDGKIHPGLMNCGTVTRRPTGSSPSPLQISKQGTLRQAFVGGSYPGDTEPRVMISADVAGQEAVVTAVESGDRKMLEIFLAEPRGDFHSMTSSGFAHLLLPRMGIPVKGPLTYEEFLAGLHSEDPDVSKIFKNIRGKYGKGVGFTLLYGGGYTTVAESLLIQKELAKEIFDGALRVYDGLKPWQERTALFAREHGYTQSPYGTRRHAPADLWSDENGLRMRAERQVTNFLAQGTSADMLKVARQEIYRRGMRDKYRMRAIAPIYDEIRASVPVSLALDYMEELNEAMSITPPGYPVGMQIEFSVGWNWGEKLEIGLFTREAAQRAIEELLLVAPREPQIDVAAAAASLRSVIAKLDELHQTGEHA